MYLNCHSFYSLRYGTLSPEQLVEAAVAFAALVLLSRLNLRQFREDTGRSLSKVLALELG